MRLLDSNSPHRSSAGRRAARPPAPGRRPDPGEEAEHRRFGRREAGGGEGIRGEAERVSRRNV